MAIKDKTNRNFLHLAILNGAKLQDFGAELYKVSQTINSKLDDNIILFHYRR